MLRKIIQIDEGKCNGCGLCAEACHEGAIGMVDGVAKLLRDDYCDGLGDCLPSCPTSAITFTEREAAAYDEAAVLENMKKKKIQEQDTKGRCPGTQTKVIETPVTLEPLACGCPGSSAKAIVPEESASESVAGPELASQLRQWPIQIKLLSAKASYLEHANLLIAADCTAYAYGDFHNRFIKNKITLIGCPKLDAINYAEKLTEIIKQNDIKSVTVVRMEVPCCGALVEAVKTALKNSGKMIPWQVQIISTDGRVLENE